MNILDLFSGVGGFTLGLGYVIACSDKKSSDTEKHIFKSNIPFLCVNSTQFFSQSDNCFSNDGGFADFYRNEHDRRRVMEFCRRFEYRRRRRDYRSDCKFLRNVDGVSEKLDRVGLLGNSLFPAIPYQFAKAIKYYEHNTKFNTSI